MICFVLILNKLNYKLEICQFLEKLKIELPYDPAIPFLGIYLEKTTTHLDICTLMFIAAPFATAKTWK